MRSTDPLRSSSPLLRRGAVALAALPLLLALGCKPKEEEKPAQAEAPVKRASRVEVARISAVPFDAAITLVGQTEANEKITVAAEAPGRVTAVNYDEGQTVTKGQWLARVDASVDRTRLGQLQVGLEQARRDLARLKELKGKGLATDAQIEQAQLGVDNAEYNIRVTRSGLGKTTVNAPISGIVETVHTEAGEYANPGAPLVTILDWDTLLVTAGLPESDLPYAAPGKQVKVHITALNIDVDAKIRRIGVQANTANRTFPLIIEVPNADHKLRPGMRADVILQTERYEAGLMVPRDAVIETVDGRAVFVVEGDTAHRRFVEIGPGKGAYVLITRGVEAGQQVVTVGQRLLSDNEHVQILKTSECCQQQLALNGAAAPAAAPAEAPREPEEAAAK